MRKRFPGFVVALVALVVAGLASAQNIWTGGYGRFPPRFPTATTFDGSFHFCRVAFQSDRREKQGWTTDYPGADLNFPTRLAELTKVRVKMIGERGEDEYPDSVVVRLTDEALFQCPFTFMQDVGTARFTGMEIERLREYLLKGGFLLVSDYHGVWALEQFDEEIGRALPPHEYPVINVDPPDHPMWKTMFPVTKLAQVASIASWRRSGGGTIERWNENADPPSARAIADKYGRLMVVMIHNTDMPDTWEREGEDPEYFFRFSPEGYAMGIDILLYGMTH